MAFDSRETSRLVGMIVIYNVPGAVMIAAGVGAGLVAHTMGLPSGFAAAVAGGIMGGADVVWRGRGDRDPLDPKKGGMLYYLPIWLVGMLTIAIGLYFGLAG